MELSLCAKNAPSKMELNGGSTRTVEAIWFTDNIQGVQCCYYANTFYYDWHLYNHKFVNKLTMISYHKLDNTKLSQLQSHTPLVWYQALHRSQATQSKPLLVSQPGQICVTDIILWVRWGWWRWPSGSLPGWPLDCWAFSLSFIACSSICFFLLASCSSSYCFFLASLLENGSIMIVLYMLPEAIWMWASRQ